MYKGSSKSECDYWSGCQQSKTRLFMAEGFADVQGKDKGIVGHRFAMANLHCIPANHPRQNGFFGAVNSLQAWQPEAPEIRTLRALLARLDALVKDIQREENRLEKAEISCASEDVIESIQLMLKALRDEKRRLERQIDDHIDHHPKLKHDRQLLESIPGIGTVLSRTMLAVIHSRSFDTARQCAAYLGLNPVPWESGSSIKGAPRMSKAGPALIRAKLYMGAIVASQWNPDIKAHRERLLAKGKSKMSLGAAMRKLVHICFGVLKQQVKYVPQAA